MSYDPREKTWWEYQKEQTEQKTRCAACGELKHTPLRRDEMGGYVCLTCIDKRLDLIRSETAEERIKEAAGLFYPLRKAVRKLVRLEGP